MEVKNVDKLRKAKGWLPIPYKLVEQYEPERSDGSLTDEIDFDVYRQGGELPAMTTSDEEALFADELLNYDPSDNEIYEHFYNSKDHLIPHPDIDTIEPVTDLFDVMWIRNDTYQRVITDYFRYIEPPVESLAEDAEMKKLASKIGDMVLDAFEFKTN